MAFYTIDQYYDIQFYNECKQALKNNNVPYEEFINIKSPYNWYLKFDENPIVINYDIATSSEEKWMVATIKPQQPNDDYLLLRRHADKGGQALLKFIENEPLKEARLSDYAVFFTIKNREEGEQLTIDYPGKVWFMGKYYENKYRLCLAVHPVIKGFLNPAQILLEKKPQMSEPGRFESILNWKIFRQNDNLIKFLETPYFESGKFIRSKIHGDHSAKFTP